MQNIKNRFSNLTPKQKLILLLLMLGVGLFILIAIIGNTGTLRNQSVEDGDSHRIYLNDEGRLQDLLFDEQYFAVQQAVSDYIVSRIGEDVQAATMLGNPTVPKSGLINFKVETKNPKKNFTVEVDRTVDFDKLGFSIVGTDYKKTILVYTDAVQEEAAEQDPAQ